MKISVCIPMFNENQIIASCAQTVCSYMNEHFDDWELIFADDGSTDGCGDTVRSLGLEHVRVVGYEKNRGKGCAVRTAMLASSGDIVMFTDADLAYGTDVIGRAVDSFAERPDAGLVIGSRNLGADGYDGYTFLRKLMSKIYIKVLCVVGGFRLSDSQCGCKAFSRSAVDAILPRCEVDRFAFDFEAILWAEKLGLPIVEMPVKVINHRASKVRVLRDSFQMLGELRRMKKRIKKAQID